MDAYYIAYLILAGFGLIQGALFTIHLVENRRFVRGRCRRTECNQSSGHVQLFVPCKGHDTGLRENLAWLLRQDHPDYQVTFVVETEDDLAVAEIRAAIEQHPHVPTNLVIAGRASDSGQKVHNLRAATERLDARTRVLAFVDSDARPKSSWLRHLTERLDRGETGAITGYRWFVPQRQSPANVLLCNINAVVAGMIGPGGHQFIWGGSWAIRREVFEKCKLRSAWQGTLSDDLVATQVIRQAGLEIQFEPKCLVASPLETNLAAAIEFVRRQFVIGRIYATRWWAGALVVSLLSSLAFWSSVAFACYGVATGDSLSWIPVALLVALWALHSWRAWLRQEIARFCLPEFKSRLAVSRWLDVLAAPVFGIVSASCLASSLVGRTIAWRGIEYVLSRGGKIARINRPEPPALNGSQTSPNIAPPESRRAA